MTALPLRWAVLAAATLVAGCALSPVQFGPRKGDKSVPPPPMEPAAVAPDSMKDLHEQLRHLLNVWIDRRKLERDDGHLYGVDLGQVLVYAASVRDRALYDKLRPLAEPFIVNRPEDAYTRGFVRWRYRAGEKPDASGTAEGLWIARGLWLGSKAFGLPRDRQLSLLLIDGYQRHEFTQSGIWYVRNYFNFGVRSFATNSYTVNYMPDFLAEVAAETGDARIAELARNSRKLILSAVSAGGLMNSIVQPEVAALHPDLDVATFAPAGIVSVFETCGVIETVAESTPELARDLLERVAKRGRQEYYLSLEGTPYPKAAVTYFPATCLLRLAVGLGNDRLVQRELKYVNDIARTWYDAPLPPRLFTIGQFLLTLAALERWTAGDAPKPGIRTEAPREAPRS